MKMNKLYKYSTVCHEPIYYKVYSLKCIAQIKCVLYDFLICPTHQWATNGR